MRYRSTRDREGKQAVSLSDALANGLALDGGLYLPVEFPKIDPQRFGKPLEISGVARTLLAPFFSRDVLAGQLGDICTEAFNFDVTLRAVAGREHVQVLELFHGPTAAFKDFGARFLAAAFTRMPADGLRTVLVATSGDTGGAVAAAFHRKPGFRVVVLFPEGGVSPRQQQQLTCWGDNVHAIAVRGRFDDCQRLVKAAFADTVLREQLRLTSANSINIGRLLPQMCYYALVALLRREAGEPPPGFVVPTGNLGNATAAFWARHAGLPIGPIVLATNENQVIPDFMASGVWKPSASRPTLASAMDVGNPSNMERLRVLYPSDDVLRADVRAFAVSDQEIEAEILNSAAAGEIWCPHTAAGFHVLNYLDELPGGWVVVATAHAAKFDTVVEPLIGKQVPVPSPLARILDLPAHFDTLDADEDAFFRFLKALDS